MQCLAVNNQLSPINEAVHLYPPVAVLIANWATYGNCELLAWFPLVICNLFPFDLNSLPLKTKSSTFSGFPVISKNPVSWSESADAVRWEEKKIIPMKQIVWN